MPQYPTNQERTAEYLKKFDRQRTLMLLIDDPAPVIYDIGANAGSSLDEFMSWWPRAEAHCFEPQAECWAELDERAGRYDRVVVNRCAAGSRPGSGTTFYTHDIGTGQAGFHRVNFASLDSIALRRTLDTGRGQDLAEYRSSMNHERQVEVVRLDDYMTRHRTGRVNLLKIDTQGFEPEVLDGCGSRLSDVDVVLAELMFYDYYERRLSFSDIEKFLHPAGLRLYDISHISKNPMNGRTDWVDVIYVNDRKQSRTPRAED